MTQVTFYPGRCRLHDNFPFRFSLRTDSTSLHFSSSVLPTTYICHSPVDNSRGWIRVTSRHEYL